MEIPRIVLAGLGPKLDGLTWESDRILRIGRQQSSEVVLNDFSVDRIHAEIKYQGLRWVLRDLANNPLYPTAVNDVPLCGQDRALQNHDVIQVGRARFKVIRLLTSAPEPTSPSNAAGDEIKSARLHMRVQAVTLEPWDNAFQMVVENPSQLKSAALLALARTNRHLAHLSQLDQMLQSILVDALAALRAQRGSILVADPASGELVLAATLAPKLRGNPHHRPYSRTLAKRCFESGESVLCQDVNADAALVLSRSLRHGAMASIVCALLRTPTRRIGILHLDRGFVDDPFTKEDLQLADAIAASVAVGIEAAQAIGTQRNQFIETVSLLARAAETRDHYSGDHTRRVTDYALLLAEELQVGESERYHIQIGSPLHDIGKIGIDDAILRKPGKLTAVEFEQMKTHTIKGATMLNAMRHLVPMIPIIRSHHERWDGAGYPDGLARDQIPLTARIVSIADAFAAMTSDRPYRTALPTEQAFLELIGRAGTHFDPACVYAFLRLRDKIEASIVGA